MKKIVSAVIIAVIAGSSAWASLSWTYTGNLKTFDAAMQNGWLVQMYQDVNGDSSLGSITDFFNGGVRGVASGTNVGDDTLLVGFTASLLTNAKNGSLQWGTSFAAWSDLYSDKVYTVIYDAATIGAASHAVVLDSTPFTLGAADPASYVLSSVAGGRTWVAVPEPATFLLFGIGGMGAWLLRRNKIKSMEEEEEANG
ncbi:MAG: PEP-CTERM sorting domain-containing protein [Pontiellaceae bacterium]|nr:PEP-CTERM sorting domain-containing protein [Pontiellaceae bacterium]